MKALDPQLLSTATERLVAEFQPEQVWLFGSYAWGEPTADSDLDFMVIVRDSNETSVKRAQRAHHCLGDLPMPKDVLVPTRAQVERYRHLRASLFYEVLTQGRKLYG